MMRENGGRSAISAAQLLTQLLNQTSDRIQALRGDAPEPVGAQRLPDAVDRLQADDFPGHQLAVPRAMA